MSCARVWGSLPRMRGHYRLLSSTKLYGFAIKFTKIGDMQHAKVLILSNDGSSCGAHSLPEGHGTMPLNEELSDFYQRSGFGQDLGHRPRTVAVYTGCMLVPLPNIETRRRFLKYHDLHHLMTGYSVGRIGEGEVSAWELGAGSARISPMLGLMNLIALSTGLVLQPKRMWRAFRLGCKSRVLYPAAERAAIEADQWLNVAALRASFLDSEMQRVPMAVRSIEFGCYCALALFVHACIAIPAMIARVITDMMLGYSFFQAVKPVRRSDLY